MNKNQNDDKSRARQTPGSNISADSREKDIKLNKGNEIRQTPKSSAGYHNTQTEPPRKKENDSQRYVEINAEQERKKVSFKNYSKSTVAVFFGLVALTAVGVIWLLISIIAPLINVSRIDVRVIEGESPYSAEEIAEYAGISTSDKFYSINTDMAEEKILSNAPYVREVKVKRSFFHRICIEIKLDAAVYYIKVSNQFYALSADMRALERSENEGKFLLRDLIRLKLPNVRSAMTGLPLVYGSTQEENLYIGEVLSILRSADIGVEINAVLIENKYNIEFVCGDRFLVDTGGIKDIEIKLKALAAVISEEKLGTSKARINISNPQKVSAVVDDNLNLNDIY